MIFAVQVNILGLSFSSVVKIIYFNINLDIDEKIEIFFAQSSSRFHYDLLNCLNVAHDASYHQSCHVENVFSININVGM